MLSCIILSYLMLYTNLKPITLTMTNKKYE